MTIGFKNEQREVMIEAPISKDKHFAIINSMFLFKNDDSGAGRPFGKDAFTKLIYARKMFETIGGKKLRPILTQFYEVRTVPPPP